MIRTALGHSGSPARAEPVKILLQSKAKIRAKLPLMAVFAIFVPSSYAKPVTLTFKTVDDIYMVSFDSSRISERQMRELIILSPYVVGYMNDFMAKDFWAAGSTVGTVVDKSFIALPLEVCGAGDPAYSNCGSNDISAPDFMGNAEINLQKSRRGLPSLQHLDPPSELVPVFKFLQEGLALSLWIEETRFAYYTTWDENILKAEHAGIDPTQLCQEIFQKLNAANSKKEKYEIVRFDWANCMVRAVNRQLGRYPIDSWNAFLKAYGISEHYEMKGPD